MYVYHESLIIYYINNQLIEWIHGFGQLRNGIDKFGNGKYFILFFF